MFNKHKESTWFLYSIIFLVAYCLFLFVFRNILASVEPANQTIFKPEVSQIIAIGIFILLFYFSFSGLHSFSLSGKWQKIAAISISVLITASILYGFKQLYEMITTNPFLSFNQPANLPWYTNEKYKFLIANSPLILFFISVFIFRLLLMINSRKDS